MYTIIVKYIKSSSCLVPSCGGVTADTCVQISIYTGILRMDRLLYSLVWFLFRANIFELTLLTIEPAPIVAPVPTVTPPRTIDPPPIKTSSSMMMGLATASRFPLIFIFGL